MKIIKRATSTIIYSDEENKYSAGIIVQKENMSISLLIYINKGYQFQNIKTGQNSLGCWTNRQCAVEASLNGGMEIHFFENWQEFSKAVVENKWS